MTTGRRFREFAVAARRQGSPLYEEWAGGIAADDEILRLLDRARPAQRQPVLVLAVCRLLGAPESDYSRLRAWMLAHRDALLTELDARLTQTNDVRRVAPIALALAAARVTGPVSLLEVGAAMGLALYPDRYAVELRDADGRSRMLGDPGSAVRVSALVEGASPGELGAGLPVIGCRAGLDLAPLDVRSAGDVRWLETLLWPGQTERLELLRRATSIARRDPAILLAGDAVDDLAGLVAEAVPGTTPVVVTAGTLVYLPGERRQRFVDEVARLGVRWISYERTGLLEGVHATFRDPAPAPSGGSAFATLALDGRALAVGDAHGTRLRLL